MDFIQKELQNEFPKFKIRSIKDEMATVDSFLRTFDIASNISFFFGTIIAVIIIYSLISINVKNKRTEIGILRAIGIKESNIILAYLFLTIIYLTFSFIFSLLILKLFEIYFQNNPIHSPFGLINPFIDYKFFVISFLKLLIILLFISYLPIRSVVKENLINQIRS
jgi:ABC-type antimicrobial peptide transport system permease subunit